MNRPVAAALTAAILLAVIPAASKADDAAAALMAKHKAFVGWQLGDGTFKTLRIAGVTKAADGTVRAKFTNLRAGLIYHDAATFTKTTTIADNGFTGSIFWQSDENGFTTPELGDSAKADLALDVLLNEAVNALPVEMHGSGTADGKNVQVVRATMKGGMTIDLSVDPDTGAFVQADVDSDGSDSYTIHFLGYTEALPGKKVVSSFRYNESTVVTSYTKIEPNVAIADRDFEPPAATASWNFANTQPFPLKVTDTRLIVQAKVNGVPGTFILDTGADGIYLTKEFAAKAHAKPISSGEASGIGGSTKTEIDRLESIDVGGNTLSNVIAYSNGEGFDKDAPDGLMGFSLLAGAVVRLDTSGGHMTIEDPTSATVDASQGVALNVDLSSGVPQVPMKIDNAIDVKAMLDSGNFYYVLFSPDLITRHGLKMLVDNSDAGYLAAHPVIGGAGGYEAERCGHVDNVALGPIVYQNAPACESHSFSGRDVLIGYDFLRHFDYVFDYPHGHLIMVPHKE